jgi:hypothetical protein
VCLLLLLIRGCALAGERGFLKAWWPVLVFTLCVGLLVFIEFNLDRNYVHLSMAGNYIVMWAALLVIAACEIVSTRRRLRRAAA